MAAAGVAVASWAAPVSLAGAPLDFDALRPIDALVADSDPLAVSLREQSVDLLVGTGFGRVYVDPSNPGLYVRRDGATYAVSTETLWAINRELGVWPVVAPGTVFYIGEPWVDPSSTPRVSPGGGEAELVSRPVAIAERVGASEAMVEAGRRLRPMLPRAEQSGGSREMSDEAYRRARLWEIARRYGGVD